MNKIGAPEEDTLGRIYPFSIKSYNYSLSSTNSGALMRYEALDSSIDPGVSSMEKYRSRFEYNPGISLRNMCLNSSRMGKYSMHFSLSGSTSQMLTAKTLQPFLTHLFACKIEICLTKTFFGMP